MVLKRTPLYENHLKLKGRMVPFAGFEMPVQYQGVLEETKVTRSKGGLFDVSHMGQFSLRGKNTLEALQPLLTNDLSKLKPSQAQYHFLCNEAGGVIDDLIVYRRSEEETYICVNASNIENDFAWMRDHLPKNITFINQSDETALIAAQGPMSEAILSELASPEIAQNLKYYYAIDARVAGIPCYLSRTGYTGEDGFELYLNKKDAPLIWNLLLEKGFSPIGLGARDTLRLEMGYPLHGHELGPTLNARTANLNWVIKLNHSFIGREAIEAYDKNPEKILVGLKIEDRRIPRTGFSIANAKKETVGEITSGTFSPHLNCPIAFGFVNYSERNSEQFFVSVRESLIPAKKVATPFLPPHVKK